MAEPNGPRRPLSRRGSTTLGHPDIDLEVEGIVDRIGGINRRIKKGMKETLVDYDLTPPEWRVLTTLSLSKRRPPQLARRARADLELSSRAR